MREVWIFAVSMFFSLALFSSDRQPDVLVDEYHSKLDKLTKSFLKRAENLKKELCANLMILAKRKARKGDGDGAKAIKDLVKRLRDNTLQVEAASPTKKLSDDIGVVPPPPDDTAEPAPLADEQLEAGRNVKVRRIIKPKSLHTALAALNPAYNKSKADFVVKNGVIIKVRLNNTGIVNISPLAGLKHVISINLDRNPVWNLAPLSKLRLAGLSIANTDVRDLKPLKNMKLRYLNISGTKVSDISLLKRMPIQMLNMANCVFIKDFTPLKRMKNLQELLLPYQATKDENIVFLKKLKSLLYIDTEWHNNKQSAGKFWETIGK